MTIYKKRPPVEPKFRARQYLGVDGESFLKFLRAGSTCTTINHGYGQVSHQIEIQVGDERIALARGQWVVYDESGIARIMSDEEFAQEFVMDEMPKDEASLNEPHA